MWELQQSTDNQLVNYITCLQVVNYIVYNIN